MARRGRPPHPDILTPREWDVLSLLREGLTNDQIGARLGITERTAKFHVSEILGKLGVASREEAATWQREEEQRPWWAGVLAPIALAGRSAGGVARATGILLGAGAVTTIVASAVLLAVLLARSDDGAATPVEPVIAFSAGQSIYTMRPDGSDLQRILRGPEDPNEALFPAFSPDGTQIAFIRDSNIWIANANGSDSRVLAEVAKFQTPIGDAASNLSLGAQSIAWSPDGKHIAYMLGRIGGSGVQNLWVMSADGTGRKELSRSGGEWQEPVWLDNDRVSVVAPGRILVFGINGEAEPAITLDSMRQFSLIARPTKPLEEEWLVGPITEEGPITLGSPSAARKAVAAGIAPALAPGGWAFAYFVGDTLRIGTCCGVDEQILDLAPLGGRNRFFGESYCVEHGAETCSYVLPQISWSGSAEEILKYLPARSYRNAELEFSLKYPAIWSEGAPLRTWTVDGAPARRSCSGCSVFGQGVPVPHGVFLFAQDDFDHCIVSNAWTCPAGPRAGGGIDSWQQGDDRVLTVGGYRAGQAEVLRNVPVGVTNATGDTTPDREIWTFSPMNGRVLVLVAFWREGDLFAEQETRAGYDMILKSLQIE